MSFVNVDIFFLSKDGYSKKIYVPRVEDKNSHMRMFNMSRMDDLIANSMNILEPAPVDSDGNEREDGNYSSPPLAPSFSNISRYEIRLTT